MSLSHRINIHEHISKKLNCLNDEMLSDLLHQALPLHSGIGGTSMILTLDKTKIFVKMIALTDLERKPEHAQSTANIFDLPLFYQYGVGSAGFGAWRELVAHQMTSECVLSKDCSHFPLLYHWRALPAQPKSMTIDCWKDIEKQAQYWENSKVVETRLQAIHNASAQIVLFLEFAPKTLYQWLGEQLKAGESSAESAFLFVEENLEAANNFMNTNGLVHFDAHFENILTDGQHLLVSDFGLALSSNFQLTNAEKEFFENHRSYDRCSTIVNLLHCTITSLFGKDQWELRLKEYINVNGEYLPPSIDARLKLYAPVALVMDEFYQRLQKESKNTPYPSGLLESLLVEIDNEKLRIFPNRQNSPS